MPTRANRIRKVIAGGLLLGAWLSVAAFAAESLSDAPSTGDSQQQQQAQQQNGSIAAGPEQVVNRLHDTLLALSSSELSVAERAARLEPVVRETHNLAFIARLMLRRDWEQLDAQQRKQFLERFARLSVMDYAGRFRDMQQGQFAIRALDASRANRARVEAELTTRKRSVSFVYTLDHGEHGWQIVSIVVDGVSEMALRRNEYSDTLANQGFAALLALVDKQIAQRQAP